MKNNKGFTLVEIMIAVVLVGIVSVIGGDVLISVFRSYNKSKAISEVERTGNYVLSFINTEVRRGSDIKVNDPAVCGTATECISYTDINGVASKIEYFAESCPSQNGSIKSVKDGADVSLTNTNLNLGVSAKAKGPTMFSLRSSNGVTYVGLSIKITQGCTAPVSSSGEFNMVVEARGY